METYLIECGRHDPDRPFVGNESCIHNREDRADCKLIIYDVDTPPS